MVYTVWGAAPPAATRSPVRGAAEVRKATLTST